MSLDHFEFQFAEQAHPPAGKFKLKLYLNRFLSHQYLGVSSSAHDHLIIWLSSYNHLHMIIIIFIYDNHHHDHQIFGAVFGFALYGQPTVKTPLLTMSKFALLPPIYIYIFFCLFLLFFWPPIYINV